MQKSNSLNKILVIADDIITCNFFLDSLDAEGFAPLIAQNGILGVQAAHTHLPDLVICDLLLSDIDGYTVLTTLRQNSLTANIPLIFLTNDNSRMAIHKAMELGANDYLVKPSTVDRLLKSIAIQLEKHTVSYKCHFDDAPPVAESNLTMANSEIIFPNTPHLKEVFDYIEGHYHEGITLSDVAEAVGYSSAYLTNQVAKQTGNTVNGWIVKRRMAAARPLLKNTTQTIEEIATKLGYQNPCHFSRQFRQHHNLSPSNWRKQHQLLKVSQTARLQFLNRKKLTNPVPSR